MKKFAELQMLRWERGGSTFGQGSERPWAGQRALV